MSLSPVGGCCKRAATSFLSSPDSTLVSESFYCMRWREPKFEMIFVFGNGTCDVKEANASHLFFPLFTFLIAWHICFVIYKMPHTHDLLVSTGQPYQQSYTTIRALFCPSSPLCLGVFLVDHPILRGISEIMETYVYFFDRFPNIYYETKKQSMETWSFTYPLLGVFLKFRKLMYIFL